MKLLDTIIRYGMLLFIFLIPWQARLVISSGQINGGYWEYGTQSLYATEVLLLGVLFALIAKGASHYRKHKPRFYMSRLLTMPGRLFLFLVWAGITIFWSIDRQVALEHWIVLIEASVVFLIIASGAIPLRKLSWAVIASGSIQAILAFVQFRWQWLPASSFFGMAFQHASILGTSVVETDAARWLRGYGSFPHPNILGGWLVLGLLLAIKEVKQTPIAYIAVALMSVGLAVTFSRGAWLAFAVGFAVYVLNGLTRSPHRLRRLAMTCGVMAVFVGVLVSSYPEPFQERLFGHSRLEIRSTEERTMGITESLSLISLYPVTGVGIGNYGLAVHRDLDSNQPAYYYQPVHNVPLLMLVELGIVGVMLILWFLLSLRGVRPGRMTKQSYGRMAAGFPFLLSIIVIALFDHYVWSLYAGVMTGAVYLGIFYLILAKSSQKLLTQKPH